MARYPAYKVVYNKLKEDIDNDVYPVGTFLPPEGELEKIFHVSRTTVRHAIDLLVRDGIIRVKQGHGTEVVNIKSPGFSKIYQKFHNVVSLTGEFSNQGYTYSKGTWIDRVIAPPKAAKSLGVNEKTEVFRIQRVLCNGDRPFCIMTNYLRTDFFPDLDAYTDKFFDLYLFLQKHYNVSFTTGIERLTAIKADFIDAQLLEIAPGTPLFYTEREAMCQLGPLEYLECKILSEVYSFVVAMEGTPQWYYDPDYQNAIQQCQ